MAETGDYYRRISPSGHRLDYCVGTIYTDKDGWRFTYLHLNFIDGVSLRNSELQSTYEHRTVVSVPLLDLGGYGIWRKLSALEALALEA